MRWLILPFLTTLLLSCSIPKPLVERIKAKGELVVLTRKNPTTYHQGSDGVTGFEYELVSLFAEKLGVKPVFVFPKKIEEIIPMVQHGEVDMAAAGLTITEERKKLVRFSPSYMQSRQQLVYLMGHKRPRDIDKAAEGILEVVSGSSHAETLQRLKQTHPDLKWTENSNSRSQELIQLVAEQVIDYTIADSNEIALSRRFYPNLQIAFDLTPDQPFAWAFQYAEDASLYEAAKHFIANAKEDGTIEQLTERYYSYLDNLDFVDKRTFQNHLLTRLPTLTSFFKEAETETGIDWMLLAAIGYQESHWDPGAVSPTGVKGIMMLTKGTAKQVGINDRKDPRESILGGARYVKRVEGKIPDRIPEPDRILLTLAGYNVGFGHLEDARILAQRDKADPDKWVDVKQYLPLLRKKKYYSTVKHGKANGGQPVIYVDNIRNYYDMLKWYFRNQEKKPIQAKSRFDQLTPSTL